MAVAGSLSGRVPARAWLREYAPLAALAVAAGVVVGWLTLGTWQWTDYDAEARPALDALLSGHLVRFAQLAPAYGGSLLIRAPFALIPKLWGGGELSVYRAAAAPCLAAAAALGVWLGGWAHRQGRTRLAVALAVVLCAANPIAFSALSIGHPEDLLGAVLCVAAVLLGMRGRPIWAGVLLGLAIANKSWSAAAVGPLLLALPDRRPRALLAAALVAGAVLGPIALLGRNSFASQAGGAAHTGTLFNPWQWWWFLGAHAHSGIGTSGVLRPGYRVPPGWIAQVAHPLIIAVTAPLTLICFWLRRRGRAARPPHEPLLLLMLLLLLRVALDPWNNDYYVLPFLIALAVWETLARDRLPVLALLGAFLAWFVIQATSGTTLDFSPDLQAAVFVLVSVPAALAIVSALFVPGRRVSCDRDDRHRPGRLLSSAAAARS